MLPARRHQQLSDGKAETMLKRWYWRIGVVIGYPLLLMLDAIIAWSGVKSWSDLRAESNKVCLNNWNRY